MTKMTQSIDKEKVRKWAKKVGRKVLWKDKKGIWHASTNKQNTPYWCIEKEDV